MPSSKFIPLLASAAILATPAQRAAANEDFAVGVVSGILGTILVNNLTRAHRAAPPPNVVYTTKKPVPYVTAPPRHVTPHAVETPERKANRVTQTALNYFGFSAGSADGIFGPKTESAVRDYQSYMHFHPTGVLTAYERKVLVDAYQRGLDGAPDALAVTSTQGVRGLLWEEHAGAGQYDGNAYTGTTYSGSHGGNTTVVTSTADFVSAPPAAPKPRPLVTEVKTTTLPMLSAPVTGGDLAAFCTSEAVRGPRVTPVSMTDPIRALDQAFCAARGEAIETSERLASGIDNVSMTEVESQCAQFAPVLTKYVAALPGTDRAVVLNQVRDFVDGSGANPAQLSQTAKICLGIGYRTQDMTVALGTGLILSALGQPAYGEIVGHHLRRGFGVDANADRGLDWLVWATDEMSAGAMPAFGDPVRVDLVDEAVYRLNGGVPSAKNVDAARLPVIIGGN